MKSKSQELNKSIEENEFELQSKNFSENEINKHIKNMNS